jgi:hypothetical protein
MSQESAQIAKGAGVAVGTMGGGVYIVYAQTIIGCIGILAGAVLSIVLTIKAVKDMKSSKMLKQATIEDIKYRQKHDLPCRRCSDDVVCDKKEVT